MADPDALSGTFVSSPSCRNKSVRPGRRELQMNGLIYLIGLIVVVMFVLSFLGLR
jgi:hypothetical protein